MVKTEVFKRKQRFAILLWRLRLWPLLIWLTCIWLALYLHCVLRYCCLWSLFPIQCHIVCNSTIGCRRPRRNERSRWLMPWTNKIMNPDLDLCGIFAVNPGQPFILQHSSGIIQTDYTYCMKKLMRTGNYRSWIDLYLNNASCPSRPASSLTSAAQRMKEHSDRLEV